MGGGISLASERNEQRRAPPALWVARIEQGLERCGQFAIASVDRERDGRPDRILRLKTRGPSQQGRKILTVLAPHAEQAANEVERDLVARIALWLGAERRLDRVGAVLDAAAGFGELAGPLPEPLEVLGELRVEASKTARRWPDRVGPRALPWSSRRSPSSSVVPWSWWPYHSAHTIAERGAQRHRWRIGWERR